jgi:hypothetical protein
MNEVFVPLSRTTEVFSGMTRIIEAHGVTGGIVGTAASRSTASLMPYVLVDGRQWSSFFAYGLVDEFAQLALDLGGRPAGIGLWMAYQMPTIHDPGTIEAMKAVKRALDPKDIMNPGKLVHAVSKFDLAIPAAMMSLGTKTISMVHSLLADEGKDEKGTASTTPKPSSDEQAEMVEEERAEDLQDAPPSDEVGKEQEG